MNNPAMQDVLNIGPLPQGIYEIGLTFDDAHTGPLSMRLMPEPSNEMFGRDDFLIHGDNAACDHTASRGCIILSRDLREKMSASEDRRLEVVA